METNGHGVMFYTDDNAQRRGTELEIYKNY